MPPFVAFAWWDKLVDFYEAGGPFMAPLTVCALVAVVVAFLRLRALRRERVLPRFVRNAIEKLPAGTDTGHIWQLVDENPAALARIAKAGLQHMEMPRAENTGMVQTAARREIMRLKGGLGVLELIVGIAPLLGLLGAISGLVGVFSNLGDATTGQDTAGVALGIAEALNTTIFGLAIAIPTLVIYTALNRRVQAMAVEMESLMASLLSKCYVPRGSESLRY